MYPKIENLSFAGTNLQSTSRSFHPHYCCYRYCCHHDWIQSSYGALMIFAFPSWVVIENVIDDDDERRRLGSETLTSLEKFRPIFSGVHTRKILNMRTIVHKKRNTTLPFRWYVPLLRFDDLEYGLRSLSPRRWCAERCGEGLRPRLWEEWWRSLHSLAAESRSTMYPNAVTPVAAAAAHLCVHPFWGRRQRETIFFLFWEISTKKKWTQAFYVVYCFLIFSSGMNWRYTKYNSKRTKNPQLTTALMTVNKSGQRGGGVTTDSAMCQTAIVVKEA